MGLVVPKGRKHLCADALLRSVQDVFCQLPEHRQGDPEITLGDALMSACAMFSLKSPSLLAFDKVRAEDNLQSIYGLPGRIREIFGGSLAWVVSGTGASHLLMPLTD